MRRLNLTLDDLPGNIALDEALLETAEAAAEGTELLRLWEPTAPMVVLGRSSPTAKEVNLDYCRDHGIPVIRRCSGGQTIVTGPGCLMYAVLLDYRKRPELRMLDVAHRFVMGRIRDSLSSLGIVTEIRGTSDLTWHGKKVSGNSLRCKRSWVLYHGTLICNLSIDLIARCLGPPIRQPEYRQQRSHSEFLAPLDVPVHALADAIATTWDALEIEHEWPATLTADLLAKKYQQPDWNFKL